jgi:hypothetical protein
MNTKKIFFTMLLSSVLVPVCGRVTSGRQNSPQATNPQPELVSFCSLAKNPDKYKGSVVRLKAVLAESQIDGIVHGDDPFLYDPRCRDKGFAAVVRWAPSSYKRSTSNETLERIRKRGAGSYSRASVTLVGVLSGYGKKKYGDRGWADAEFTIHDVEKAAPVAARLPWRK